MTCLWAEGRQAPLPPRAVNEGGPSPEPPREQPDQAWASELRGDVRGLAALPMVVAMQPRRPILAG